jgi:hypothetical protein
MGRHDAEPVARGGRLCGGGGLSQRQRRDFRRDGDDSGGNPSDGEVWRADDDSGRYALKAVFDLCDSVRSDFKESRHWKGATVCYAA